MLQITLKVNKLSSTKTSLPYEFYQLPFCKPDTVKSYAENLGEVLRGDRIECESSAANRSAARATRPKR